MNVTEFYEHELKQRGYQSDEAQRRAVERLQQCYDEWVAYKGRRNSTLKKLLVHPEVPKGVRRGLLAGLKRSVAHGVWEGKAPGNRLGKVRGRSRVRGRVAGWPALAAAPS